MNYEKKYKEALEKARQFSENPLEEDSSSIVEYIFPELQESEDEKIRKVLIDYFNRYKEQEECGIDTFYGIPTDNIIAWLEKQGEQKTADKVEPKFKVGDWISGYYTNYKVTAINSKGYVVEDTDGNKINILFENEKFHHLFTIADAKNGDVLVVPHIEGSEHSEQIFIFKEIKDREYAKNAVEYYCRYLDGEFRTNERGFMGQADDYFTPATKEQRDILFAKMEEAGYEWDADKKELKKIVAWLEKQGEKTINQPDFEIPFGAKDSELIEESYYIPKGYHAEISKDKVTIKKGEQRTNSQNAQDIIKKYVSDHADCRWLDASELEQLLNDFVLEYDIIKNREYEQQCKVSNDGNNR